MTTEAYLQIMIESLQKKSDILNELSFIEQKQIDMSHETVGEKTLFDKDVFDKTMNDKDFLIQKLDKLDEGFEETYQIIRQEVLDNKEKYKEQIKVLQELVSKVVDQGVALKTQESRLKFQLDHFFHSERESLRKKALSNQAAKKYANSMSKINYIDPQLMDRKK